jgi:hypothetical protein
MIAGGAEPGVMRSFPASTDFALTTNLESPQGAWIDLDVDRLRTGKEVDATLRVRSALISRSD